MIERHVTFHLHQGAGPDFEEIFVSQYRPAMSRQPGFNKVELLRELDQPSTYQMVIRFDSAQHALDWRNSNDHEGLKPGLRRLYSANEVGVFNVVA